MSPTILSTLVESKNVGQVGFFILGMANVGQVGFFILGMANVGQVGFFILGMANVLIKFKAFPSPRLVTIPRLKSPVYSNTYL